MNSGKRYPLSDNRKSQAIPTCVTMTWKFRLSKVGFPIRKSVGQRPFAPHHSLSQRTTSFIASYRQGIHQMLLVHLITLISNAHPVLSSPNRYARPGSRENARPKTIGPRALLRKTRSRDEPELSAAVAAHRPVRAPADRDVR